MWIHTVNPHSQTHWLSQFSLELVQLGNGGLHSTACNVPFLEMNHHCYLAALQDSRENCFSTIMLSKQFALAVVCQAPGQSVVSKGAAVLALASDALVGDGDVLTCGASSQRLLLLR